MNKINILLLQNENDWLYLIKNTLKKDENIVIKNIVSTPGEVLDIIEELNLYDIAVFDENIIEDNCLDINLLEIITQIKKIPLILMVNDINYYEGNGKDGLVYLEKSNLFELVNEIKKLYKKIDKYFLKEIEKIDDNEIKNRLKKLHGENNKNSIINKIKDFFIKW
jgi:hypothetical protein